MSEARAGRQGSPRLQGDSLLVVNRTYGTHKNIGIHLFFANNIWSYLLLSPVIVVTPSSPTSSLEAPQIG